MVLSFSKTGRFVNVMTFFFINLRILIFFSVQKDVMQIVNAILRPFEGVPSRNVNVENLEPGDHIKFRRYIFVYAHHAIVTRVDNTAETFTVVHFYEKDGKLQIIEETKNFNEVPDDILLVDYTDASILTPKLPRLPRTLTIAIATFFRDNQAFRPYKVLMNNCEHFAFTCTLGFAISFQQLKAFVLLLLPLSGLNFALTALTAVGVTKLQRLRSVLAMRRVVTYVSGANCFIIRIKQKQWSVDYEPEDD